jgi:hypothetical protein
VSTFGSAVALSEACATHETATKSESNRYFLNSCAIECKDNKKRKTESGKRKTFVFRFSLGVGKRNRRTKQEQRVLAHYALQEGGKALEEGLKRKTESGKLILHFAF